MFYLRGFDLIILFFPEWDGVLEIQLWRPGFTSADCFRLLSNMTITMQLFSLFLSKV